MSSAWQALWQRSDGVSLAVALVLLGMSVLSWTVMLWKWAQLRRQGRELGQAVAAFWAAPDEASGRQAAELVDGGSWVSELLLTHASLAGPSPGVAGRLPSTVQHTRTLRAVLGRAQRSLNAGHGLLASVGSTAPFVGLLGTVWSTHQALGGLGSQATLGLEAIAAPVGEALLMTAAGLAVSLPAVLGFNALSQMAQPVEAELEGLAHDLLALPGANTDPAQQPIAL